MKAFIKILKAVRERYKEQLPFIAAWCKYPQREDVGNAIVRYLKWKENVIYTR